MSTVLEKLQELKNIKDDFKEKINAKGGSITDTTPFSEYPSQVENLSGGSGGGSVNPIGKYKVVYFDIDGTILKTDYVESGGTTTPPGDPSYDSEYLKFVGWTDIPETITRDYVVGARYETITGDTYLFIRLTENIGLTIPTLQISGSVSIDWGDGTIGSSKTHTYSDYGDYTIKIRGMTGITTYLFNDAESSYLYSLKKCYLGNSVVILDAFSFLSCRSLEVLLLSKNITEIGNNPFTECYNLKSIILPDSVNYIGFNWFYKCYNLSFVVLPTNITAINGNSFSTSYNLEDIVIPNKVTSIESSAFSNCYNLKSIVIPESVTNIQNNVFSSCYRIKNYIFNCLSVPTLGSSVFTNIDKTAHI